MYEPVLIDQNPHWRGDLYPDTVQRDEMTRLREYLQLPHIISLVGVRRSGKSTLVRQLINKLIREDKVRPSNILFLNLENPRFITARENPAALEDIYDDYLKLTDPAGRVWCFLDEVQFFSEWQVFVKSHYEKKGIKFVVTGSNSCLLSSEFISLLSGRTLPLEVHPFSFREFVRAHGLEPTDSMAALQHRQRLRAMFDEYLRGGGFPETALLKPAHLRNELLAMYAKSILYQDIAPRFGVKKPEGMEKLFYYLLSNTGAKASWNSLAGVVGLSDKTIKEYLSYFSDAYLMFALDMFNFSVKKQINSAKKIYGVDNGLITAGGFQFSGNEGHLLENLLYLALRRQSLQLNYYVTSNGLEVDFAAQQAGRITGLYQAAWNLDNPRTRNRETRALFKAMAETGLRKATIVTYESEEMIRQDGLIIEAVPAVKFLLKIPPETVSA